MECDQRRIMTEKNSNCKSSPKGLKGSLAARVLLAGLIFLVIPLVFHALWLFFDDYKANVKENFNSLNLLGRGKVEEFNQMFHFEITTLGILESLLKQEETQGTLVSIEDANELFNKVAEQEEISSVFLLKEVTDGTYLCVSSSDSEMIGENFTALVRDYQTIENDHTIFLEGSEKTIYASKFFRNESGDIVGSINIALSSKALIHKLDIGQKFGYKVQTSLVTKKGLILASNETSLVGSCLKKNQVSSQDEKVIGVKPVKEIKGGFTFDFLDESYIATLLPLEDSDLQLLVNLPEKINFLDFQKYLYHTLILLGLIVIFGGGGAYLITMRMARPLKHLSYVMGQIGDGDLSAKFTKDKMGFEINILGERFNEMIASLLKHMEEVEAEKVAKETLKQELLLGHSVQQSLLPKDFPRDMGFSLGKGCKPANEVGGDFYDLFAIDDGKFQITIADAAGKGVFACLYSLSLRSMLRAFSKTEQNLSNVIKKANNLFCSDTKDSGSFVTGWVGQYDKSTRKLRYVNCGHNPPMLRRKDGTMERLQSDLMAFGADLFSDVQVHEVTLEKGDLLLLFTDGVVEAHNENMEMYGDKRVEKLLNNSCELEAKDVIVNLYDDIDRFTNGLAQFDDITTLLLKMDS